MIRDKQQAISKLQTGNYGYKKLVAWQRADELAHLIYEITATFPKSELFGITSQIRRSGLSVPANIVEGYARANKNVFRNCLSIALGSLAELEYFISFAYKQSYISDDDFERMMKLKEECGRIIWRLYQSQMVEK